VVVSVAGEGETAILRVSDQGPGIAAEQLASIFERFAQQTPSREPGGLGLGLWICREIVRTLGGTIAVTSAPGAGAVFTIVLPCDPGPEATS
jgi:signal transduction histidine kinase